MKRFEFGNKWEGGGERNGLILHYRMLERGHMKRLVGDSRKKNRLLQFKWTFAFLFSFLFFAFATTVLMLWLGFDSSNSSEVFSWVHSGCSLCNGVSRNFTLFVIIPMSLCLILIDKGPVWIEGCCSCGWGDL